MFMEKYSFLQADHTEVYYIEFDNFWILSQITEHYYWSFLWKKKYIIIRRKRVSVRWGDSFPSISFFLFRENWKGPLTYYNTILNKQIISMVSYIKNSHIWLCTTYPVIGPTHQTFSRLSHGHIICTKLWRETMVQLIGF